jgi:hypothetical protein
MSKINNLIVIKLTEIALIFLKMCFGDEIFRKDRIKKFIYFCRKLNPMKPGQTNSLIISEKISSGFILRDEKSGKSFYSESFCRR